MKYLNQLVLKILCTVIVLFYSINTHASFVDTAITESADLAEEVAEKTAGPLCNLFCSDIHDTWPSTTKTVLGQKIDPQENSYNSYCLCPPYNKTGGRRGCLLKTKPPVLFNIFHMNICAEESPESNYFEPKIRYRAQTCNAACWTLKGDLAGAGECTLIPTSYGVPLIRLCARMAVPADPANDKKADEGYVVDKHLDFEGYWVDDNPLSNGGYDENGKPKTKPNTLLQVPKICMYWDPSLIDTLMAYAFANSYLVILAPVIVGLAATDNNINIQNVFDGLFDIDFMDYNPVHQSRHHSSGVDPVVQMIIDFAEGAAKFANSAVSIGDKIKDTLDPTKKMIDYASSQVGLSDKLTKSAKDVADFTQYSTQWIFQLKWILKAAIWILENVGVEMLKFFGTLNRVVSMSFGCVNVPLGPMPPPYCSPLPTQLSFPTIYPICTTTVWNNGSAMLQQSTSSDPCNNSGAACTTPIPFGLCMTPFVSGERNNVVHNSIRVGFSDNKPLCTGQELGDSASTSSGKCVNINGVLTASELRSKNGNKGTIKLCSQIPAAVGETPCVESSYLLKQNAGKVLPEYRLLYSLGSAGSAVEYFDESIPDCVGIANSCQSVWGVNIGSFGDLVVTFQNDDSSDPKWSDSVTLLDTNNAHHVFKAAITRTEAKIDSRALSEQEPDQICVYEIQDQSNTIIGCQPRAMAPKPKVRECSAGICTSSFLDPHMVVKLEVPNSTGFDFTEAVAGIDDGVNLAGYDYQSYATDAAFVKKPFSGSHAILNGASIYGNYIGGAVPYTIDQAQSIIPDSTAIYLNGLEYLNGEYQKGIKYLCLTGYKVDDCLSGETRQNCVLSKLLNTNVMQCTSFATILGKYHGIEVCDINNTNLACNYTNPKDIFNGNNNVKIKIIPCVSNATGATSYCYDYGSDNGPLCKASENGVDRLIPPTTSDVLPNGSVPNIDYYNYTPGVLSSTDSAKFTNLNANASIVQNVQNKAQEIAYHPIDYKYTQAVCTSNTTFETGVDASYNTFMTSCALAKAPNEVSLSICVSDPKLQTPSYNITPSDNIMEACTNARNSSDKVNAICTQTLALVTDNTSTLYSQLSNACNLVKANITNILKDQFDTQLVSQMQSDAVSAATEISHLMSVINNLSTVPSLVTNIIKAEQNIYSSTDAVLYPTIASKITAICSQTQALIVDRFISPTIYDALDAACTIAKTSSSQASLDTLNNTVSGFTQYNVAGSSNLSVNNVSQAVAFGDYIPPDFNTMKVRNRTDLENGVCIGVPQPSCSAIETAAFDTGNATWATAGMGEQSIGTCKDGTIPKSPTSLKRYCLLNADNTTSLESLTAGMGCKTLDKCTISVGDSYVTKAGSTSGYISLTDKSNQGGTGGAYQVTDINDIPVISEERELTIYWANSNLDSGVWPSDTYFHLPITIHIPGAATGDAISPSVIFSNTVGCPNFPAFPPGFLWKDGLNWLPVTMDTRGGGCDKDNRGDFTIKINCDPYCPAIDTATANTGYATWTRAKVGELSTGTCANGYVSSKPIQAACLFDKNTQTQFSQVASLDVSAMQSACTAKSKNITNLTLTENIYKKSDAFIASDTATNGSIQFGLQANGSAFPYVSYAGNSTIKFNIVNAANISSFKVSKLFARGSGNSFSGYGSVTFSVNGHVVNKTVFSSSMYKQYTANIDIKKYLVNGANTIIVTTDKSSSALGYQLEYTYIP